LSLGTQIEARPGAGHDWNSGCCIIADARRQPAGFQPAAIWFRNASSLDFPHKIHKVPVNKGDFNSLAKAMDQKVGGSNPAGYVN